MGKKGFMKAAAFLSLFVGLAAGVSAQLTVSGGFALSMASLDSDDDDYAQADAIGFGGNAYLDWLLPLPIPLSLGLEAGYDTGETSTSNGQGKDYLDRIGAIPLLARVAYHFDIAPKLDLYVVGKIGYAFGTLKGDSYDYWDEQDISFSNIGGLAWGFDLGVAYYFTPRFGLFAEGGFDRYMLKTKGSYSWEGEYWMDEETGEEWWEPGGAETFGVSLPFTRFFTVGISLKF